MAPRKSGSYLGPVPKLIEERKVDVQPKEIIACYNAGGATTDPEFALITTKSLIYLKDGRTTVFPLKEIKMLKDNDEFQRAYNPNFFDGISYRMEVQSKEGQRMRIVITPREEGGIFFDALKSAIPPGGVLIPN